MNTFVIFLSRVIGYFVDRVILRNDRDSVGIGYTISVFVLDLVLGFVAHMVVALVLASARIPRRCRAADLMGTTQPMQHALARLVVCSRASSRAR